MSNFAQIQEQLDAGKQEVEQVRIDLVEAKKELQGVLNVARELQQTIHGLEEKLNRLCGLPASAAPTDTLRDCLVRILQNANEPLTVSDLAGLALESGYKTRSKKHFNCIVAQCLSGEGFRRVTKAKTRPARFAAVEE